ncbi:unnamed protein product [Dibothriocephalus latus]|uniref:SCP domain-containing protein n=1 Tax=Dibothriocephalus latus TaxID=60516 RepID=A0A3P7NMR5_DIBLA|nr:unnamed protein product [Dibothriocephalus latus]
MMWYGEIVDYKFKGVNQDGCATDASLMWYGEIVDYKFKGVNQDGCGHFTQLVWKDTKVAGFGVATTADGHSVFVVGQYYPPGNVMSYFGSQVPYPLNGLTVVPTAKALMRKSIYHTGSSSLFELNK